MKKSPSPDLAEAIAATREDPPAASLDDIRSRAVEARDLELEIENLESRLKDLKSRRMVLVRQEIPEMMDSVGMSELKLVEEGNLPALRLKLYTEYKASIPESWDQEKRRAAFNWLDDHGAGDLILTGVTVDFTRDDRAAALRLRDELSKSYVVGLDEKVHWKTLSAWLKEYIETNDEAVPLDVIGGYVTRTVKVERE